MASHACNHQGNGQPTQHHQRRQHRHHQHHQHHHQQDIMHHYPHHSQLRLKCIILGSAGAGKTSLLRRFVHGTFENDSHEESSRNNNRGSTSTSHHHISSSSSSSSSINRSTTSTLGADYYVKKVDNPLFGRDDLISNNRRSDDDDDNDDDDDDDGYDGYDGYNNKKKYMSLSSQSRDVNNVNSVVNSESHVLVQLWDTAGRERLKLQTSSQRFRNNPATYANKFNYSQFLSIRPSHTATATATNNGRYDHRYNNWGGSYMNGIISSENCFEEEEEEGGGEQQLHITRRNNTHQKHQPMNVVKSSTSPRQNYLNNNKPMGDALFRNIDACVLVYDAT